MKKYLHYEFDIDTNDVIEINMSFQANTLIMDDSNFLKYRRKHDFSYLGGYVKATPYRIKLPRKGHWHVVIEKPNQSNQLRAVVRILKNHEKIEDDELS